MTDDVERIGTDRLSTPEPYAEDDQVVAGALRLLAAVESGTAPMTREQARAGWMETIIRTEAMLTAPGMEPEERQRLRRRVERLRDLQQHGSVMPLNQTV